MQPPAKRRKVDSLAVKTPADDRSACGPEASHKEIPESPQDNPGTTQDGTSRKPMPFIQRPRFAPFFTEDVEQLNARIPTQSRFTQRPRFSSSILDMEEQQIIQSAKSTPKSEIRRKRPWSPGFGAQPATTPRTNDEDRSDTEKYSQLIGMALHAAPDNSLNTEQIYKWVIDNVPDYDLENVTWRDGIWVTLTVIEDFVRRDGNFEGPWTFRDGASTKYRPQDHLVSPASKAGSSSKFVYANGAQVKQGTDASAPLGTDHDLEAVDLKPSRKPLGQAGTNHLDRAGSETNSALPSTIEETIDIIDLTMDEDETPPSVSRPQSSQTPAAAGSMISLLRDSPEEVAGNKQRSTFVGFGEPTWSKTTSATSARKSLTPFTDRIVENASKETIESLSGTEKWKVAKRHINNLLGSPTKATASTDIEITSLKSPPRLSRPEILADLRESTVAPARPSIEQDGNTKQKYVEPNMANPRISMQDDGTRQSAPVSEETAHRPTVENHASKKTAPATNGQVMSMHIDSPEKSLESKPTNHVTAHQVQAPEETINSVETRSAPHIEEPSVPENTLGKPSVRQGLPHVERIQQEPLHEEPSTEGLRAKEQLIKEPLIKAYTDSAAQTDSPAASSFALGTITQISLEPQAPVKVTSEAAHETAESSTQTEILPELQAALHPQPPQPPVQITTTQEETTKKSRPKKDKTSKRPMTQAAMEESGLRLLDSLMYPTKEEAKKPMFKYTEFIWPAHLEPPPQQDPDSVFFDHEAKMEEIRARPTRKQIFGKVALSRVAGNDALTKLNEVKLGKQRIDQVNIYKGYTDEEIEEEKKLNDREGYYNTVEELLGLPQQVVPQIYEQQLAFRDYAPVSCFGMIKLALHELSADNWCGQNKSGRIGRAKHIYKIGPNAR